MIGDLYYHYKGDIYDLLNVSLMENGLCLAAVYRSLRDSRVWIRPMEHFKGIIWVNLDRAPCRRFERIGDLEVFLFHYEEDYQGM